MLLLVLLDAHLPGLSGADLLKLGLLAVVGLGLLRWVASTLSTFYEGPAARKRRRVREQEMYQRQQLKLAHLSEEERQQQAATRRGYLRLLGVFVVAVALWLWLALS